MPEMYFDVRWPDGLIQRCHSPSTIVEDYFTPGSEYELAEFVERSRTLPRIERTAAAYGDLSGAKVMVEALTGTDGSLR